jgi:PKD repeat protein
LQFSILVFLNSSFIYMNFIFRGIKSVPVIICLILFSSVSKAQISTGGTPISFVYKQLPALTAVEINKPDMTVIEQEDAVSDLYKTGRLLPVNLNLQNSGTWYQFADGSKIWRLKIHADGAKGISLYYNQFWLPEQSKFYLFSEDETHVIGGFTSNNNHQSGLFATEIIKGETIVLEYFQPAGVSIPATINVSDVGYCYRGFETVSGSGSGRSHGTSLSCMINVNCSEGNNYESQKRAVARVLLRIGSSQGWCTGSLINNTAQDCTPYFLLADHCGTGSSASNKNQWIFYFNYQASGCSNPTTHPSQSQTITGCTLKANTNGGISTGSDFLLIQLNSSVPTNYNPYFAGWNRQNTTSSSGVGIHHPAGDIKKISTYNTQLYSTTDDVGNYAYWAVQWASTANGRSIIEPGSSGSSLFNSSGLVIGTASAISGTLSCSNPGGYNSVYGKFSYHWDQNGTAANVRLKPWLDPNNSGVTSLTGTNAPDFTANVTTIFEGQSVNFTDLSTGSPTAWNWTFTGGTPSTSTVQNPQNIVYSTAGSYTVTLTASKAGSTNTATKTAYITVLVNSGGSGCDTLSNIDANDNFAVYGSGGAGYVSGHNQYGDLAKADKFTAPPSSTISKVLLIFAVGKSNTPSRTINVRIWNANGGGGTPNTVLGTTTLTYSAISSSITNQTYAVATFNPPVAVSGAFYAGIEFAYLSGDTVALVTNVDGESVPTTAWEKTAGGTWQSYNDGTTATWQLNVSHAIFPEVCSTSAVVPTANFTNTTATICAGSTVSFTDISTGSPTSWNWTFTGGTPASSTLQNPTITYNTPGTYNVSLTAGNTAGSNTKTVNSLIVVRANPVPALSVSNVSCSGNIDGAANTSVTGGQSPYTYLWSTGITTQNISNLTAGSYVVTVTDANGCKGSATANITEPTAINVTSSVTNSSCASATGAISLTVSGGSPNYTYTWSNGATSQNVIGLTSGSYTVTVRDANNCQSVKTIVVNNTNGPSVAVNNTNVKCFGGSDGIISLVVSGGSQPYTYQWSNGSTTATVNNLLPGNYTFTVTDAQTCRVIQTVTVIQPANLVTYTSAIDTRCAQSNGSANIVVTGGTSPYTYSWSSGGTSSTLTNIAAGNYSVTVTDINNCQSIKSVTVGSSTGVTINISTTNPTCNNPADGSVFANVTTGVSPFSYQWNNASQAPSQSNLASGTYILTVTDADNCSATSSVTLTVNGAVITPTIEDVTGCYNSNTGSIALSVTNASQPVNFSWNNGASSSSVSGLSAGRYTVTITENSGCTHIRTYDILAPDTLSINISVRDATNGNNGSATLNVSGGTPGYNYLWSNGITSNSANNLAAGNYTVTVVDNGGCQQTISFTVDFNNNIINVSEKDFISIFPNPAGNVLNVKIEFEKNQMVNAELYNNLGALLIIQNYTGVKAATIQMDLHNLPNSTYILKLYNNDWSYFRKIIKTRSN